MRSPRAKSPKTVREFINERIGMQARDDAHNNHITKLEEEKKVEKDTALTEATV